MSRHFNNFSTVVDWRKTCPVCKKDMIFEIATSIYSKQGDDILTKITNHFNSVLNPNMEEEKIEIDFKPAIVSEIEIKEIGMLIKFTADEAGYCYASVPNLESAMNLFNLKIYCYNELLGYNEYEADGEFDFEIDFSEDINKFPKDGEKLCVPMSSIKIDYEKFNIFNIHLEDEKPNGNIIKITNDYGINKTSFSMAETALDGSFGTWKEKRIELVDDSFFKFSDSEKIYGRLNAIFLLK